MPEDSSALRNSALTFLLPGTEQEKEAPRWVQLSGGTSCKLHRPKTPPASITWPLQGLGKATPLMFQEMGGQVESAPQMRHKRGLLRFGGAPSEEDGTKTVGGGSVPPGGGTLGS